MSCKNDCDSDALFPADIFNRPALPSIRYCIGRYSSMREHMLDTLNADETLQNWTHRGADDPGIAILECNAMVGDVLSFYQQLYANEAFVRTAQWRESISDLVQISGYRLAPGVAGDATFALTIKGDEAVSLPAGFGFKAQLEDRGQQDEFESLQAVTLYPRLGEFSLYRPPRAQQNIRKGGNQLELIRVDGKTDLTSRQGVDIKPGDRIALVPDFSMFDVQHATYSDQETPEILIVKSVETVLNRIVISFEGSFLVDRGNSIRAYVIDRSFRHFGYNATSTFTNFDGEDVNLHGTEYDREIHSTSQGGDFYSSFSFVEMPLDQEVKDLAAGGKVIVQGMATEFTDGTVSSYPDYFNRPFMVVRNVEAVEVENLRWANLESSVTVLTVDKKLFYNNWLYGETMDIRKCRYHEVVSPELLLAAPTEFNNGSFVDNRLQYYGYYQDVVGLAERRLLLLDSETEQTQQLATTSTLSDFQTQLFFRDRSNPWLWTVTLDEYPAFDNEAFDQAGSTILVYGNLVDTDQGKTQTEVVLGNGDNRRSFQTFAIPKTPLTYVLDETQVPELDVYVDGVLWSRVDNFFDSASDDQVYVVREDNEQNSYVQFGDGMQGARLPSGIKNVTAMYRTGVGAAGMLEADAKPSASGKLKALDKVYLHTEVTGGDEAEGGDNAREAAPQKMQSLGRLVGVADYEAEARHIPGVLRVNAVWSATDGVPALRMVVLTESGTSAAVEKVQQTLNTYNRCRGPARFAVQVIQGNLQYVYLKLRVGFEATRKQDDMDMAIRLALGVVGEEDDGIDTDEGLFSLKQRRFGQTAHVSQIIATVQQVGGVRWVEVDDAQSLNLGDPVETDPESLPKPVLVSASKNIACMNTRILALHKAHLDLSLIMDDSSRECSE